MKTPTAEALPTFPLDQPEALVLPAAVAGYRKTTEATLAFERHMGTGPRYIKVGRKVLYKVADVVAFIDACVVEPVEKPRGVRMNV